MNNNIPKVRTNNDKSLRSSFSDEKSLINGKIVNHKTTNSRVSTSSDESNLVINCNGFTLLNEFNVELSAENIDFDNLHKNQEISNLDDLKKFLNLVNINNDKNILDQIQLLDLRNIEINATTDIYIYYLLNLDFPNLLELNLGNIKSDAIIFSCKMPKLKLLSIGTINPTENGIATTIHFTESFNKLKTLKIESIEDKATLSCSGMLDELQYLMIGDIKTRANLDLIRLSVRTLESMHIRALFAGCTVVFPQNLDTLSTLSIGQYNLDVLLCLPKTFPNLERFVIGNLKPKTEFTLFASMSNLRTLSFGNVGKDSTIKFLSELHNLTFLQLGHVGSNANIQFPTNFCNLTNFTIGRVKSTQFQFPFMPKIRTLSIGSIYPSVHIQLLLALDNLTTLKVGNLYPYGTFDLSDAMMPSLEQLQLGYISDYSTLKLSNSFKDLKDLSIEFQGFQNQDHEKDFCQHFPNAKNLSIEKDKQPIEKQQPLQKGEESSGKKKSEKKENCCIQ